ncbi:DUF1840 domain-containing protein [Acidihalobacter prosperus]|uniref:DUF1840 domain-containing protein n=1 Tax=Acidihalobacter prosperus TaxID=160660 RepID=A0A1A6C097_9GAMM|nr:DUF1840 domain-containing protein [Acidihalobacter prosperus]OBS07982.1 hypothetical protein Thpro_022232 [Acidihalobacter prosperus]
MLVIFSTPAYADIMMFGDVAVRLIRMMGHSGTVPGAIVAEDVPAALTRLQASLAVSAPQADAGQVGYDDEPAVGLPLRARPLIELLTAAASKRRDVMWDRQR